MTSGSSEEKGELNAEGFLITGERRKVAPWLSGADGGDNKAFKVRAMLALCTASVCRVGQDPSTVRASVSLAVK